MNRPGLSVLAQKQLAAWVKYAQEWDVFMEDGHVRCARCKQSITRLSDRNGVAYTYSPDDQWSLLVAHIRQAHQEVEEEVYGTAGQDGKASGIALDSSGGIPDNSYDTAHS